MPVCPVLQFRQLSAGDVEGHRNHVADLEEFDVAADFHNLAGDLVAEYQAFRCGGAAADHVLVRAANVGGDGLEDDAVVDLAPDVGRVDSRAILQFEFRVRGVDQLDFARSCITYC